jgi:hypothetical protein
MGMGIKVSFVVSRVRPNGLAYELESKRAVLCGRMELEMPGKMQSWRDGMK